VPSSTQGEQQHAFTFIDLFAGIGGFHAALGAYGGKCEYAVEIDPEAAKVYELNWGMNPLGDITKDVPNDNSPLREGFPEHDILAAGFPCQPFSKSGKQHGMDETRGTLFWNILRIIEERKPTVVLLENVRNLAGPRHTHEWEVIVASLREQGYRVASKSAIFSPHLLPPERGGRPQVRERVFITATLNAECNYERPDGELVFEDVAPPITHEPVDGWNPNEWCIDDFLDDEPDFAGCALSAAEEKWIEAWDEFVRTYRAHATAKGLSTKLPGFPIWADEWGLDGQRFERKITEFGGVPSAKDLQRADRTMPAWKASHIAKNLALYADHGEWIAPWAKKHGVFTKEFPPSRRKLEWQAQDTEGLWDTVMHLRPSGIRAKRPTYLPALVAITQTSIIGPRRRRVSPRETARLQSLPDTFDFGAQRPAATYKQMGNGVNAGVVWHVLREHVLRDQEILNQTEAGRRIRDAVLSAPLSLDDVLETHSPATHPEPELRNAA